MNGGEGKCETKPKVLKKLMGRELSRLGYKLACKRENNVQTQFRVTAGFLW